MKRIGRVYSNGCLRAENRDYAALARAAIAALVAEGLPVTAAAIGTRCRMSPHNACQALRFLRSTGEIPAQESRARATSIRPVADRPQGSVE